MSEDSGKITRDPLFLALTRPPMIFGVTYSWFAVTAFFWVIVFINTNDFGLLFPGLIVTHLIGYYSCSSEPRFVEIFMIWAKTVPTCMNRFFHGNCCSYDLY
jgi:type IV secretion system protein VirB3